MKHASTRIVYEYWNKVRGDRLAPARVEIDPSKIRHALSDTLMLAADFVDQLRFRLAGTRVCALFGREIKGQAFAELCGESSRKMVEEQLSARQGQPARPLYTRRPPRISLPSGEHVAGRLRPWSRRWPAIPASASLPMSIILGGWKAKSRATHSRQRLRHDHEATLRSATNLPRSSSEPAGRPPAWPFHSAQDDGAADPAERQQRRLPYYRRLGILAAIAISPDLRPATGAMVNAGKVQGRVVRHIEDGFAIEFTRLQHPDFIEDNLTGHSRSRP